MKSRSGVFEIFIRAAEAGTSLVYNQGMNGEKCIYCGQSGVKMSEEHVVPEAIGGTECITPVCEKKCNNQILSELDKELCSYSPLSIVAARILRDKSICNFWMIDPGPEKMMIEATYDADRDGIKIYPQMLLTEKGPQIRGDHEEIAAIGWRDFRDLFEREMLERYHAFESGNRRRLIPEKMRSSFTPEGPSFPPRIFAPGTIREVEEGKTFKFRYVSNEDRRRLLYSLSNWPRNKRFRKFDFVEGSTIAGLYIPIAPPQIARALIKIGLNLLRYHCSNTEIDREHFPAATELVIGPRTDENFLTTRCGFLPPETLSFLAAQDGEHRFLIIHDGQLWTVYSSFFGGRVATQAQFPGPSNEKWKIVEVTVPLFSKNWRFETRTIYPAFEAEIEWQDVPKIIPSVPLSNGRVEEIRVPKKKRK